MSSKNLHLGDLFRCRKERGKPGLPVLSVTMNNGLVHRDTLERKSNGTLKPEEHLLIREGDIAYNMMRMWQGASGLADADGIVSPAYVVVAPKNGIDPLFASYWFKSERMIYLFWAYSYGITGDRLRLYYKDFKNIPVVVPPKAEQKRIGRVLAATDQAIEKTERLISAKRQLKNGLAQRLLSGDLRLPGCTQAWTSHRLDTVSTISKGAGASKADLASDGVPVIRYGELYTTYDVRIDNAVSFISPESATRCKPIARGDVLLAGSGEDRIEIGTAAAYMGKIPAFAGGDVIVVSPKSVNSVFLAYLLDSRDVRHEFYRRAQGESVVHLYMRDVACLELQLPDLEEQEAIASVLSAADIEIGLLFRRLGLLRTMKKGLMQQLLTADSSGRKETADA